MKQRHGRRRPTLSAMAMLLAFVLTATVAPSSPAYAEQTAHDTHAGEAYHDGELIDERCTPVGPDRGSGRMEPHTAIATIGGLQIAVEVVEKVKAIASTVHETMPDIIVVVIMGNGTGVPNPGKFGTAAADVAAEIAIAIAQTALSAAALSLELQNNCDDGANWGIVHAHDKWNLANARAQQTSFNLLMRSLIESNLASQSADSYTALFQLPKVHGGLLDIAPEKQSLGLKDGEKIEFGLPWSLDVVVADTITKLKASGLQVPASADASLSQARAETVKKHYKLAYRYYKQAYQQAVAGRDPA